MGAIDEAGQVARYSFTVSRRSRYRVKASGDIPLLMALYGTPRIELGTGSRRPRARSFGHGGPGLRRPPRVGAPAPGHLLPRNPPRSELRDGSFTVPRRPRLTVPMAHARRRKAMAPQQPPMSRNLYAIVIGVDRYLAPTPPLNGAVRNALAMARWLNERGGVPQGQDLALLSWPLPDEPRRGRPDGLRRSH